MSDLQAYYDDFRRGRWADENESVCLCRGSGWALSDVDTWHKCPIHFCGQLRADDCDMTYEQFTEADHLSRVEWAVVRGRASFTREEQVRREPVIPVPLPTSTDDEIPF